MDWLRHKNGGGKIFGNDAEVSADTFLDRSSIIRGDSNVYHSHIEESEIIDSIIVGATVRDSVLNYSRTWDSPVIESVSLKEVAVFGNAILRGPWSLDGPVRIHAGVWTAPPRWDIIEGMKVSISECTEGRFHLGCWCLPYETWARPQYRQRIGARAAWSDMQIAQAFKRFTEWNASL